MMGVGKTTVGKRLAARLGVPFVDADIEIETAAGCPIEEIFARHGEAAFRDGERRVIARLLTGDVCVLAAGGGAFNDPETRRVVAERAISVWLRADVDLIMRRVGKRSSRPLLKTADPRATVERLLAERTPIYALADMAVDCVDGPPDATAGRIIAALETRCGHPVVPLREAS
ncbi:MAG: shikimate kinase [Alphaproteobacteria bacterium]